jgi:hypothetical protein
LKAAGTAWDFYVNIIIIDLFSRPTLFALHVAHHEVSFMDLVVTASHHSQFQQDASFDHTNTAKSLLSTSLYKDLFDVAARNSNNGRIVSQQ